MALITWNDRYLTGIPQLDEQHKALFEAVNAFHAQLVSGVAKEDLAKALDAIQDHVARHFETEEEYMRQHEFSGFSEHRAAHALLLEELADFKDQWSKEAGSARPTVVARFLADWLTHHIQGMDLQLRPASWGRPGSQ